jgi:hypothetical protein
MMSTSRAVKSPACAAAVRERVEPHGNVPRLLDESEVLLDYLKDTYVSLANAEEGAPLDS